MANQNWQQKFIDRAAEKHQNKYDYSKVVYVKAQDKVEIICPEHGSFMQRPNDHRRGDGCPKCKFESLANGKRRSVDDFVKKAKIIHGDTYDYTRVAYVNAITKIEIVCSKHGSFWQTPDKHFQLIGCTKCSQGISRGELAIQKLLDAHNIEYEREKRFNDLVGSTTNSRLRYDFWLPQHNTLVEYDGEHHFSAVRTKGKICQEDAVRLHERTASNDVRKTEYAALHSYNLLRIRYDESIEERLLPILRRHS